MQKKIGSDHMITNVVSIYQCSPKAGLEEQPLSLHYSKPMYPLVSVDTGSILCRATLFQLDFSRPGMTPAEPTFFYLSFFTILFFSLFCSTTFSLPSFPFISPILSHFFFFLYFPSFLSFLFWFPLSFLHLSFSFFHPFFILLVSSSFPLIPST